MDITVKMSFMDGREFGSKTGSGFVSKDHEVCVDKMQLFY